MKARAGETEVERVERLDAGIFQMIFGVDMDEGLRLSVEGDSDFLLFDDVAGAE